MHRTDLGISFLKIDNGIYLIHCMMCCCGVRLDCTTYMYSVRNEPLPPASTPTAPNTHKKKKKTCMGNPRWCMRTVKRYCFTFFHCSAGQSVESSSPLRLFPSGPTLPRYMYLTYPPAHSMLTTYSRYLTLLCRW